MTVDGAQWLSGLAYPQSQSTPGCYLKDPDEFLDYQVDWGGWLPAGDTIADSAFTADAGLTVELTSFTATTATVWLSGGTVDWLYHVVNRISTHGGRITEQTLRFIIKQK